MKKVTIYHLFLGLLCLSTMECTADYNVQHPDQCPRFTHAEKKYSSYGKYYSCEQSREERDAEQQAQREEAQRQAQQAAADKAQRISDTKKKIDDLTTQQSTAFAKLTDLDLNSTDKTKLHANLKQIKDQMGSLDYLASTNNNIAATYRDFWATLNQLRSLQKDKELLTKDKELLTFDSNAYKNLPKQIDDAKKFQRDSLDPMQKVYVLREYKNLYDPMIASLNDLEPIAESKGSSAYTFLIHWFKDDKEGADNQKGVDNFSSTVWEKFKNNSNNIKNKHDLQVIWKNFRQNSINLYETLLKFDSLRSIADRYNHMNDLTKHLSDMAEHLSDMAKHPLQSISGIDDSQKKLFGAAIEQLHQAIDGIDQLAQTNITLKAYWINLLDDYIQISDLKGQLQ